MKKLVFRNAALNLALLACFLLIGQGRGQEKMETQMSSHYLVQESGVELPSSSPDSIVFPGSPWTSGRFGQYQEEVQSPEYIPMEGQLCPEGHHLVAGECKLVLA